MKFGAGTISSILGLFVLAGILTTHGQPKISGKISGGFQAPTSTDDQGRRHVLKGTSAEPRGNNLYEITDPRVTSFNADDSPETFIESPLCLYDLTSKEAYSSASLSVRTADGRFSIEGVGWRWDQASANLVISNQVVAHVQKSALATNLNPSAALDATNAPVRISANSFQQAGETASFIGSVVVQDGTNRLTSDRLNLQFVKPGGVQTIEAAGNMELIQGETKVTSGRAIYDLKTNIIRISEAPRWVSDEREGSADLLVLDRGEGTLLAEGNVYMKLPLTNVAATASTASTTSTTGSTNAAETKRFLEIYSDTFRFQEARSDQTNQANQAASALYEGQVRVIHTEAKISCRTLTVGFDATNRVRSIRAEGGVRIEREGSEAFGDLAEYDMRNGKIVLSGNPRWNVEESQGRSEVLVFYPKTKEVLALRNVEMTLPGQAAGSMFAVNARTNQPAETNDPIVIRSGTFSRGANVAVFHEDVVVTDARGRMRCELVTVVTGRTNQVERIIAEGGVRIEQQGFVATGSRADYNVVTGLLRLTGDPKLTSEDKSLSAAAFVIDRNKNTFSVAPGKYRIEIKTKTPAKTSTEPQPFRYQP